MTETPTIELNQAFVDMMNGAQEMQRKLGLPENFVFSLVDESDWSLVVKLHSVVDAALEHAIALRCFNNKSSAPGRNDEKVVNLCNRLSFDGRVSKLAFVRAFALLPESSIRYCVALNRIRNLYAHSIKNFDLSILDLLGKQGDADVLIVDIMSVGRDAYEVSTPFIRAGTLLSALSTLWFIEFSSKPPETALARLMLGDDAKK